MVEQIARDATRYARILRLSPGSYFAAQEINQVLGMVGCKIIDVEDARLLLGKRYRRRIWRENSRL